MRGRRALQDFGEHGRQGGATDASGGIGRFVTPTADRAPQAHGLRHLRAQVRPLRVSQQQGGSALAGHASGLVLGREQFTTDCR